MGLLCCGGSKRGSKHAEMDDAETPRTNGGQLNQYQDMERALPNKPTTYEQNIQRYQQQQQPPQHGSTSGFNGNASTNGNGPRTPGIPPVRPRPTPEPVKGRNDGMFPELSEWRLDETEVLLTRKISTGAFGVVWLGHYHGQPVAVKRMIDGGEEVGFSREIQTMAQLVHPKVVRFIGATWSSAKDLSAVTEFMDGGDVRSLLENRKIDLTWDKQKISIAIDVAEALAYMHSKTPKVIHRDLKSRNVLLNSQLVAKLSDFGLSRNRTYEETLTAGVGTVRWTAPEVMLGENYSEQADVYSFGVVLSELDTREIPFEEKGTSRSGAPGAPDMAIVIKVAKGELRPTFSPDCPESINKIAKACLQFDPALRPSAASVVRMLTDAKAQLVMQ
jgi:serine/threonine protein kinase